MLQVRELSKTYAGNVAALHRVSIEFAPRRLTVLLGPSGAGKSTLLRSLNLLTTPTTGHITVDGIGRLDSPAAIRRHRRRTGMIHQQHQLIAHRSALANTLAGRLGAHGALRTLLPLPRADQRIALASLDRVGLLHHARTRVDHLSGGQQQRVGIARALTQQPLILLADEPVASLDPVSATRILDLLVDICRTDGLTAVLSLHQVELARAYADRIVGLAAGRVVFDDAPRRLDAATLAHIYRSEPTASTNGAT
jgi:phosphonate transport system ATP-binding protein